MKFNANLNYLENPAYFVYGTLLKDVTSIEFWRVICLLENINENGAYKVSVRGPRSQYVYVDVWSPIRNYRAREEMAQRIHNSLYRYKLTGRWGVFLKTYKHNQLN